jgi:hypothetical protein
MKYIKKTLFFEEELCFHLHSEIEFAFLPIDNVSRHKSFILSFLLDWSIYTVIWKISK